MGVRVALDAGPLHGHRTGVGAAVAEMAAHLAERDDVELLPYVLSYRARPGPTAGRPTRRLPVPAAVAHRWWSHVDRPRLDRWLGTSEVVHGTNYVVPPTRRPRLVSVYDCWFLAHPDRATAAVRRAGAVLRRAVAAGAVVHASSTATAEAARRLLGATDVEVVLLGPPPVPTTRTTTTPDRGVVAAVAGRPFLLALGTVERRKNVPVLVQAFGRTATLGDIALVIAGAPGDDTAAVDAAVAALAAPRRAAIVRTGPVDGATKAWLLEQATALAYPSLDEGFGFPLLEAQTAGLPVVASRAGSIPEVGGRGVELVELGPGGGDVDGLAEALDRIVHDDVLRSELIAGGHHNVTRFSWRDTAAGLASLYARMAAR